MRYKISVLSSLAFLTLTIIFIALPLRAWAVHCLNALSCDIEGDLITCADPTSVCLTDATNPCGICVECVDNTTCVSGTSCNLTTHTCDSNPCVADNEICLTGDTCCSSTFSCQTAQVAPPIKRCISNTPPVSDCSGGNVACDSSGTCNNCLKPWEYTCSSANKCVKEKTWRCNPSTTPWSCEEVDSSSYYATQALCSAACVYTPPVGPGVLDPSANFPEPDNPQGLISAIIIILMPIVIVLGLLRAAQGGLMILTSQGNEQQLTEGKEIITSAVVGIIFAITGLGILRFVLNTFAK
ncbi:MAG: hypothetical protein AAB443_01485 [Patescibacteria group bacterium]